VILRIRYTARSGGGPLGSQAIKELMAMLALSIRPDFPAEWAAFVKAPPAPPQR
jgi:hypothetical protein